MGQAITGQLIFYPPKYATPDPVEFRDLSFEWSLNSPAILNGSVYDDFGHYASESDPRNSVQTNSYVTYKEGGRFLFRGKVKTARRSIQGGRSVVSIVALDKMAVPNETKALFYDGDADNPIWRDVWSRYSAPLAIDNVELFPASDYGSGEAESLRKHVYYPKYDSDVYLSESYVVSTLGLGSTLGETMANSGSDISSVKLAVANGGLPPAGFFIVKTGGSYECCQYNGYDKSQSDGFYRVYNVRRQKLGSSFALHSAGDTVYPLIAKRGHFAAPIKIEGTDGATYTSPEFIEDKNYQVNRSDMSVTFNQVPLDLKRKGGTPTVFDSVWITCAVYDEEGSGKLLYSTVLNDMLTADPEEGGPGFGGSYVDTCGVRIDFDPDPIITRIEADGVSVGELNRRFLQETGVNKGFNNDLIGWYYDAEEDEVVYTSLRQGTVSRKYAHELLIESTATLDQTYTMVSGLWGNGHKVNLCSSARFWHTPCQDPDDFTEPWAYHLANGTWKQTDAAGYVSGGGPVNIFVPHNYQLTQLLTATSGEGNVNVLTDNDGSTGLAITWDTDPGPGDYLFPWFPGETDTDPDLHLVTDVVITLEVTGEVSATDPFGIEIYSYDGFTHNGSSEPTVSNRTLLSTELVQYFTPGQQSQPVLQLRASNLKVLARGIVLHFTGTLLDSELDNRRAVKVLDVAVYGFRGSPVRSRTIREDADISTDTVLAPLTDAKLRDIHMGQYRVKFRPASGGTPEVERYYCWLDLVQGLSLPEFAIMRVPMEEEGNRQVGIAKPGETVEFSNGFQGVADNIRYQIPGRTMEVRAVNYNTDIAGAGK